MRTSVLVAVLVLISTSYADAQIPQVSVPGETLLTFLGVVRLVGSRAWVGESPYDKVKKVSPGTDSAETRSGEVLASGSLTC